MRYGAVPIVRETGGLKDTVQPYNMFENTGNGFTFDRYESGLLYDAINRAKTLYFENRKSWDDMVIRDMNKDVSWEKSAKQYKDMYVGLTPRDQSRECALAYISKTMYWSFQMATQCVTN